MFAGGSPPANDRIEVPNVLRHDGSPLMCGGTQKLLVGHAGEICTIGGSQHVMALRAQALSGKPGVMHVQKQLQLARRFCWRRQRPSSSSASLLLAAIQLSTSCVNSA